jgi:serine-type D-Ala-D-Ala carboxypeptidase (penicillin-binding protein 5/6)
MIIRSVARSAHSGTAAIAAGLMVLLPAAPAAAATRADPMPPAPAPAHVDGSLLHKDGVQARPGPGTPGPPDVSALSWLVADADTGDVLAAHDAHRKLPPASTLKTLFADTTMPHLPQRSLHTVTDADLAGIEEGSSLVGIVPGVTYKVSDLWRGVFLASGNDAVHVLASMNGGWEATVAQMQKKAEQLGALDTHVVSCDGYDEPGQVSSAYDLAVFGRTGLQNPQFAGYADTSDAQFPGDKDDTFGIENTNRLLSGAKGVQTYPGLIGVKNGYTTKAGNTLVAAARHGGRTILVTVMNPQSGATNAVYDEARSLLDWGFDAAGDATPVGTLAAAAQPEPAAAAAGPVEPGVQADPARAGQPRAREHGGVAAPAASAAGRGTGFLLPAALSGAAVLAALALYLVRRARRGGTAG